MSLLADKKDHINDFDNVTIDDNINEDLIMTIEGPNFKRTFFFSLFFICFLLSIFLLYSFLPNSQYTEIITVNAGETRKIDITNAYKGCFLIKLYSIRRRTNLNPNKLYFGQFRINLSVNYFLENSIKGEVHKNNTLIEPTFELDQKISFPVTIYEDELPKHIDSLSIIYSSERISINKMVLEFVFENSIYFTIDSTWKIFCSIILYVLLFQYIRFIFTNNKKKSRLEQKLIFTYLIILCFGSYPFILLFNYYPYLQGIQKSISNNFFLCLILIIFKTVKIRGKKFPLFPYVILSAVFTIADLIDTKYSFHNADALIGIFYFSLYLYEFFSAFANKDESEQFKFKIYSIIFVLIPFILLLSRILTKWWQFLFLKHLSVVFSDFTYLVFTFLLAYLFYPIDPIDEIEYSRFHNENK